MPPSHNIAVFGSTGSIGKSTLEVAAALADRIKIVALAAHSNTELALAQSKQVQPRWLIITDSAAAKKQDWSTLPRETELLTGCDELCRIARAPEIDTVVAAIVGSAGLDSTWAAVESGKRVALANKETLVMAGALVMQLARRTGAEILPVDSEHSAVFQALQCGRRDDLARIILTASGGPFRTLPIADLQHVTVDQALKHPNWSMGQKITIDSATMMNKSLEIIEARWLFDLAPELIDVVVHPQSIVHSMVEYRDGSVIAQLSPPDMKLPIQYALTYPERSAGPARKVDWATIGQLNFELPDRARFPALELGWRAAREGGTSGAVLNAANEAAVSKFLQREIPFTAIPSICKTILDSHEFEPDPTLDRLYGLDRWARQEVISRAWT
jgi:1-deoxy-D-xylulose-5-phosphate reductoisomerase